MARRTESINYETSRLVRKLKMSQGVVRRMSVSVLVDQSLRWQLTGKGSAAHFDRIVDPPSPDRMKVIRDVVAAAAGWVRDMNVERGESLFFWRHSRAYIIRSVIGGHFMTDSLREPERRRADLWEQILELGDFRPGSITTTAGALWQPELPLP